jgi:large subunit ribosomal protein L18
MKDLNKIKLEKKGRRHNRTRSKISGTAKRPRLSVFRSNTYVFLQLIDDNKGITLASVKDIEIKDYKKIEGKIKKAYEAGKMIAQLAKKADIEEVVFDKSSYKYHGRVKAVAEGAREGGLKF